MAYARKKATRKSYAKRGSAGARSYAIKRRTVRAAPRSRRASARRSAAPQTVRIVIQSTGMQPEARPNLQTALLGASQTTGPKKARQGGGA